MHNITDINDPRILPFIKINNKNFDFKKNIVCESQKVIMKLVNSSYKIKTLLTTLKEFNKIKDLINYEFELLIADEALFKKIVGYDKHQCIMAIADKPQNPSIDTLSDKIIILNGLTSPENVGAIIRNASAFGFETIIFDNKTVSPFQRRCIRVSLGNIFNSIIYNSTDLVDDINILKSKNYQIVSTANISESIDIHNLKNSKKIGLIIGSEGHGIDQEVFDCSDSIIKIPIKESAQHLNAAHSASIVMYHFSNILNS